MEHEDRKTFGRRTFLGYSALAAGGFLLAACGSDDDDDSDNEGPTEGSSAAEPTEATEATSDGETEPTAATSEDTATDEGDAEPTEEEAESTPSEETGSGPAGGTITYAEAGVFNDFNPWTVSAVNMSVYNQVFSRLLWKNGEGEEIPDLAESWEMADDGLSFTVIVRDGAKWHDGADFVAEDYVTMFGYTKDAALLEDPTIQKHAGLISVVKDVVAPDATTIEFQFENPVPYIADILDYWFAIRIDDPADVGFMETLPVGTGPFQMTAAQPQQQVTMTKFADYYKEGFPKLDEVIVRRLEQAATLVPNLQSETVDIIQITSLSDVGPLQEDDNYKVDIVDNAGSYFDILVNLQKPPFDQADVRRALSYSLNRAQMVDSAFFGISQPITSPFYLPASIAYREDLVMAHEFDLDMATQLLEGAGVSDLTMTTNVTPRWPQMKLFMLIWQQDLEKIGVTLTVNEVETAQFYEIGGAGDLLGFEIHPWLNARVGRDPAIFWSTQINYRGDPEVNKAGYENQEMEDLIAEGAVETDKDARTEIYQRLNEIVVEEVPIIQVASDPRVWASSAGTSGVTYDLNGNIQFEGATVEQ